LTRWQQGDNEAMLVEKNVQLQPYNSFQIVARAHSLVRVGHLEVLQQVIASPEWQGQPKFILGGGSNLVLTGDVKQLVLKVELLGKRLVDESPKAWVVEAGAGENWHDFVAWTLAQGWPGLENLALIPGTVGGAPVQNIGAYGVELQDCFLSLDAVDLATGRSFTLNAAQCGFAYRDSVFKHAPPLMSQLDGPPDHALAAGMGLAGRAMITRVRFWLPKPWKPVLGYADLEKKQAATKTGSPTAQQIFDWVCEVRRAKLPDPAVTGNAGSFFKNPTVSKEQCADIIARDPKIVHYQLADGTVKLAAGWLIDACGWKGKSVGQAGVHEKHALVLVNRGSGGSAHGGSGAVARLGNLDVARGGSSEVARGGNVEVARGATGGEVMTLAKSIQTSVYERFGILLEPEPVIL
jgi:UDP-N-acetylmuramate dehydrogenase